MLVASSYTFLDVFWSMLVFFIWVMWFMLLFRIWGDIFSRHDISGLGKTGWLLFTILLPFLGVFIYLIAENDGMNQRALDRARTQQSPDGRLCAFNGGRRSRTRDRKGEAVARQRRDHADRVRQP